MGGRTTLLVLTFSLAVLSIELGISHGCREKERKALIDFKRGLHDPSNRLSSWVGEDCCAWEGVGCSNISGHVIKLDLRNRRRTYLTEDCTHQEVYYLLDDDPGCNWALRGDITPSLCSLQQLSHLDLSGNYFLQKPIPKFIGAFRRLTYLNLSDLSSNKLVGGVPDSLCNLQTLESLHLRRNNLSGPIPLCLKSCTELVTLDLGHNNFIGNIPTWIGESLLYLKTLSLRSNAFTGSIPQLSSLTSLRILDLSNNNLSGIIPQSFGNFSAFLKIIFQESFLIAEKSPQSLVILDLSRNKLQRNLKSLDLSYNFLYGSVPASLANLSSLQSLILYSNELNGTISEAIGGLKGLIQLDLYNNSFRLPTSSRNLRYNETFTMFLDLSHNSLHGSVPTSLGNLSSLRSLFLYSNDLNGSIAEGIGGLKGLNYLVLSYNSFRLSELHLVNLSSLKYLDISYNYIDLNKGDEWIPPFQLRSLYMTFCQIVPRPHFPRWLRLQTTLRDLSLSSTSIKERIPNWLPSSLEYLSLSNNEISGDVPQYLPNLMYLDLSNNSLTDHLSPRILNMMPSLQFLDLSNNKIPGFIVGFWTICGSILLNSRWRIAYFQAIDNMCDELYVVLVLNVAMFKRKLMVGGQVD
ncbi:LRR receptor-like serine threonine-protein kinase [Musa troglodytarum]|uniref:LRR receptor-like serine threonine-protein kinase n=1 Tax=Musa troglodytarum TaxID=320322 RepID=A0A9E7F8F4_9LILI|nr:LRR receptor-like serine threonine-protein kinase [Musa troglodytarum]